MSVVPAALVPAEALRERVGPVSLELKLDSGIRVDAVALGYAIGCLWHQKPPHPPAAVSAKGHNTLTRGTLSPCDPPVRPLGAPAGAFSAGKRGLGCPVVAGGLEVRCVGG